ISAHEARRRSELARLADLARGDGVGSLKNSLEAACRVLDCDGCLLVWEQLEEPYTYWASFEDGKLRRGRELPGWLTEGGAEEVGSADFLCVAPERRDAAIVVAPSGGVSRRVHRPLAGGLGARLGLGSIIAVSFRATHFEGRLFLLGRSHPTIDDLP